MTAAVKVLRPLGAFENMLHLYASQHPFQFAMAVRVQPSPEEEDVRAALSTLRAVHPLLSAGLSADSPTGRAIYVDSGQDVPLAVDEGPWQAAAAADLATRFELNRAPLVRAFMVPAEQPGESYLMLSCSHQIADGMAMVDALRSLVALLNGSAPSPQPLPEAQETQLAALRGAATIDPENPPVPDPGDERLAGLVGIRQFGGVPPTIADSTIDNMGQRVARCRENETTLHGALCAAAIQTLLDSGTDPVRLVTPIDLRRTLKVPGGFVNCFLSARFAVSPNEATDFWALARAVNRQIAQKRSREALTGLSAAMDAFAPTDPAGATTALGAGLSAEIMVTNLGALDKIPAGRYTVTGFKGPVMCNQINGQQILGAVTYDDRLHLVNVGYGPIGATLTATIDRLVNATSYRG